MRASVSPEGVQPASGAARSREPDLADDHLAQPVAGTEPVEGCLDLVEPDAAVDQPLDWKPTFEMEPRVVRKIDLRVREAVVRAEDPAAAVHEWIDGERRPVADRRHPDEHGGAAECQRLDRELDR